MTSYIAIGGKGREELADGFIHLHFDSRDTQGEHVSGSSIAEYSIFIASGGCTDIAQTDTLKDVSAFCMVNATSTYTK